MLSPEILLSNRACVNGIEGSGKSSGYFELLEPKTTSKNPLLYVYQTYDLMKEQIKSWSSRYGIDEKEFIICGHNGNENINAVESFTNPEYPDVVSPESRFVFYSQSYLQKAKHLSLILPEESRFSRIIVDEFDYTKSIIPTFDYQFNYLQDGDLSKTSEKYFYRWLKRNYSDYDVNNVKYARKVHNNGFNLAHWLKSSYIPITFLTSEELSAKLLKVLNFDVYYHGVKEMMDCCINIEPSPYINEFFFTKMNTDKIWETMDYDYIISNKIDSFYQKSTEVLRRPKAIPHISAKGSNNFRGSKILTIISHIPDKAIKIIQDVFKNYGENLQFDEVKGLYYKAVLLQAVGRVLGYRGSKTTDVIIHSSIWDVIKNNVELPYSTNDKWRLDYDKKDDVIQYVQTTKNTSSKRLDNAKKEVVSFGMLKKYFEKKEGSVMTVAEIKSYTQSLNILNRTHTGALPASKVAKFFDLEMGNIRVGKKVHRCVFGLSYKTDTAI